MYHFDVRTRPLLEGFTSGDTLRDSLSSLCICINLFLLPRNDICFLLPPLIDVCAPTYYFSLYYHDDYCWFIVFLKSPPHDCFKWILSDSVRPLKDDTAWQIPALQRSMIPDGSPRGVRSVSHMAATVYYSGRCYDNEWLSRGMIVLITRRPLCAACDRLSRSAQQTATVASPADNAVCKLA